jgi:hypothetical protein
MPSFLVEIVNNGFITDLEPVISGNDSFPGDTEQAGADVGICKTESDSNNTILESVDSFEAAKAPNREDGPIHLPGLHSALVAIGRMMQNALPGDLSRFNGVGMRTQTGWQVLKFKTVGTRTCLNGCEHVSNHFSIQSNGGVLLYRCLSSGCNT